MVLYENVVIGNFLFGFGASYGYAHRSATAPPICVNLVQQTPLDQRLGDVLIESATFVRILEFKRPENKSTKELAKLKQLRGAIGGNNVISGISRRIHWYIEMGNELKSRIVPYIDFDSDGSPSISMEQFLANSVQDALHGVNSHEMELCRLYLKLLQSCVGPTGSSAGALIMAMTADGRVMYAALGEIADLRLERRQLMAKVAERLQSQERTLERTYSRSRKHDGPIMGR